MKSWLQSEGEAALALVVVPYARVKPLFICRASQSPKVSVTDHYKAPQKMNRRIKRISQAGLSLFYHARH